MTQLNIEDYLCDGGGVPSQYLKDNVILYKLDDIVGVEQGFGLQEAICARNFITSHVGGHGTNSPRRGVSVFGNSLLDGSCAIPESHWTACMNASHISLTSVTEPMPDKVKVCVPKFQELTRKHFPESPITSATYCLGVANCYNPASDHTICSHTDSQQWYASPCPVFASITYFPDGEPNLPEHSHRFQILDESGEKSAWRFLHLRHGILCIMRSDIYHRVIPPIKKYRYNQVGRRINVTLRNIVHPSTHPLGYYQAISNHFRYYGKPLSITMPSCTNIRDHVKLFMRYLELAAIVGTESKFSFIKRAKNLQQQQEYHKKLKARLRAYYEEHSSVLASDDLVLLSKPNLVWQTTEAVINFLT